MSSSQLRLIVLFAVLIGTPWIMGSSTAKTDVAGKEEFKLTFVETDEGPAIEVSVGDITFQANHLKFLHDNSPASHVSAVKDKLLLKRGRGTLETKTAIFPIRKGGVSRKPELNFTSTSD